MDAQRLSYSLLQAAEMLTELAQRISDYGTIPLTQRERSMCRAAMLTYVQDACDGIVLDFLNGNQTDWKEVQNNINALQVI